MSNQRIRKEYEANFILKRFAPDQTKATSKQAKGAEVKNYVDRVRVMGNKSTKLQPLQFW